MDVLRAAASDIILESEGECYTRNCESGRETRNRQVCPRRSYKPGHESRITWYLCWLHNLTKPELQYNADRKREKWTRAHG